MSKDLENEAFDYELITKIATDNWLSPAYVSLTKLDEMKRLSSFFRPRSAYRQKPRSRFHKSFVELSTEPPLSKLGTHDSLAGGSTCTSLQDLIKHPKELWRTARPWSATEARTTQNTKEIDMETSVHNLEAKDKQVAGYERKAHYQHVGLQSQLNKARLGMLSVAYAGSTEITSPPAPRTSPDEMEQQLFEEKEEQTSILTNLSHHLYDSKICVKLLRRPIAVRPSVSVPIDTFQQDHHTYSNRPNEMEIYGKEDQNSDTKIEEETGITSIHQPCPMLTSNHQKPVTGDGAIMETDCTNNSDFSNGKMLPIDTELKRNGGEDRHQSCHYNQKENIIETMMSELRLLSDETDHSNLKVEKETPPLKKEPPEEMPKCSARTTIDLQRSELKPVTKLKRSKSAITRCTVNSRGSPSSPVSSSNPPVKSVWTKHQKSVERQRNREAVKALREGSLLQQKKYTKLIFYESENLKMERKKLEEEREIYKTGTTEEAKFDVEISEMQQYLMTHGIHIPLQKLQRGLCAPTVNNYHECIKQTKNVLKSK